MAKDNRVANISSTACFYHAASLFARLCSQPYGNGCALGHFADAAGDLGLHGVDEQGNPEHSFYGLPASRVATLPSLGAVLVWLAPRLSGFSQGHPISNPFLGVLSSAPTTNLAADFPPEQAFHAAPRFAALAKLKILALFLPCPYSTPTTVVEFGTTPISLLSSLLALLPHGQSILVHVPPML